jgi:hypothetical protein
MVVAVVLLLAATAADAGEAGSPAAAERPVVFDIPAQPLAVALEVYSATTGIEVFYDAALATGRRSADVKGSLPAMRGLQVLLRGTGYVPRATGPGSISIAPSSLQTEQQIPASTRNFDRYESYLAMLQARLGRTLCRDDRAEGGDDEIIFKFWLVASGVIERAQIVASDGDRERSQAIVKRVEGVDVGEPPPPGLPEPITMAVFAPAAGETPGC